MIKKVENTVPLTYVINDLNGEENCYNFLRKKKFENVIKRKIDKLYVQWKGYNNSFNSSIIKRDIDINGGIFSRTEIFKSKNKS